MSKPTGVYNRKPIEIVDAQQWRTIRQNHYLVIADFWAPWCGPCKQMKPIFEDLCSKYAKRGKVAFVTVEANHENPQCAVQLSIFEQEGGRGLPTFKIYYGDKCWKTITGANRPELTKSVADALTLPDTSRSSGTGRTLGGNAPRASLRRPLKWDFNKLVNAVITFVGLYFVSLFTFDPYMAAEKSQFNVATPRTAEIQLDPSSSAPPRQRAQRATFRTLADLGQD